MVTETLERTAAAAPAAVHKAEVRNLSFYYGDFKSLKGISMAIEEHKVTALIGPSGCGKSTLLRCFNRMHDLYPGNRYDGQIILKPEVKNRLQDVAFALSGGQQQRLCIARALATDPELLLFDEPTSALDPIATGSIEDLIQSIKQKVTILIVTHNMQQAARVSDYTAYMYLGDLVEFGATNDIFMKPKRKETEDYITGRFG